MQTFVAIFFCLAIGAVLGMAMKPKHVVMLVAGIFGACILGILLGSMVGSEALTMWSGIAAMAVPFAGAFVVLGSLITGLKRRREEQDS